MYAFADDSYIIENSSVVRTTATGKGVGLNPGSGAEKVELKPWRWGVRWPSYV